MTVVGSATIELRGDSSQFAREMGRAQDRFRAVGTRMRSIGRTLTTTVTLPLAAVGAASVKMASDAEEAANKFDVVMGDSADSVRARLMELRDSIPLTTTQFESLAAGVQDLLVPLGLARDDAAGMSAQFVELAGDLGSFNNIDPAQALEALRSGLAGQSRPLRQFGIDASQAALEAVALREGLIEAGETMSGTVRAQALLIKAMEDSSDAQGDAARTAGSTANQVRFLVRDIKELGVQFGQVLAPVVRDTIIPTLRSFADFLGNLSPEARKVGLIVAGVFAVGGPILIALGALTAAFAAISWPVVLGAAAVAGIVAVWFKFQDDIEQVVGSVVGFIGDMVTAIKQWVVDRLGAIWDRVGAGIDKVKGFFSDLKDFVVGNSVIPEMVDAIGDEMRRLGDLMVSGTSDAVTGSTSLFEAFSGQVRSILDDLVRKVLAAIAKIEAAGAGLSIGGLIGAGADFATGGGIGFGGAGGGGFAGPGFGGGGFPGGPTRTGGGSRFALAPTGAASLSVRVDTSDLPPHPRVQTPEGVAVENWWRRLLTEGIRDAKVRGEL